MVAASASDSNMKVFIKRVLASMGLRVRRGARAGALDGLVPYYSGAKDVQSIERLRSELRKAHWVSTLTAGPTKQSEPYSRWGFPELPEHSLDAMEDDEDGMDVVESQEPRDGQEEA